MPKILLLVLALLISACGIPLSTQTPASPAFLTREQAIAAALKIASNSAPEISGALVTPTNIQAEQMALGDAMQSFWGRATPPTGYARSTSVWLVTMDGLWANEVQAPGVTATQQPYHHFAVILDSATGMEIESLLRP